VAFREVAMTDIKEVLRLWLGGQAKRQLARQVGVDPKTARSYIAAAESVGLSPEQGEAGLTEERLAEVVAKLRSPSGRPHGDAWALCEAQRETISKHLGNRVRLSKTRKLLARVGVQIPYSTLHRFAVEELGFGRTAPTIPVADGAPGDELELDTGRILTLEPDAQGKRRRKKAWIFTPHLSRHRFVWPVERETTESAILACEAAWDFYGGIFKTLKPDGTKAIILDSDALHPTVTPAFLEYAQARGFHIDPARVRSPKDKGRVERTVRIVRDDCYGGERIRTLEEGRERARVWSETEYGMRRHTRTQRLPREHFLEVEKPALLPAPTEAYDVPIWADVKVARDQCAQVARALYSLPTGYVGKTLRARADRTLVRFFVDRVVVKVHARQPAGGRSIDAADYPKEKTVYALRDVAFLARQATSHGEQVGHFAEALLDGPLPWARMRRVYALLGLCKRYGDGRVDTTCARALSAGMLDIHRLERMLKLPLPAPAAPPATVIPIARYLRPPEQYALPFAAGDAESPDGGDAQ
jgi:hypothetical protein